MKRREIIICGSTVFFAGCATTTEESEPRTNTSDTQNESSASEPSNTTDTEQQSEQPDPTVSITNTTVPDERTQGEPARVSVRVNTTTRTTLNATLYTANGTVADYQSDSISPDTSNTSLILSVPQDTHPGDSTVRITARGNGVTDEASGSLEIVKFIPESEKLYNDALDKTEEFLNIFSTVDSASSNPTILDTSISSRYTTAGTDVWFDAKELIDEAQNEDSSGQKVEQLEDEIDMLQTLYRTQQKQTELFNLLTDEVDQVIGSTPGTQSIRESTVSPVREQYNTLLEDVSDITPIVGENYNKKLTQIDSEIRVFERLIDPLSDLHDALFIIWESYNEDYAEAESKAGVAESTIDNIIEDVSDQNSYPPENEVDNEFVSLIRELKQGAVDAESEAIRQQSEANEDKNS